MVLNQNLPACISSAGLVISLRHKQRSGCLQSNRKVCHDGRVLCSMLRSHWSVSHRVVGQSPVCVLGRFWSILRSVWTHEDTRQESNLITPINDIQMDSGEIIDRPPDSEPDSGSGSPLLDRKRKHSLLRPVKIKFLT